MFYLALETTKQIKSYYYVSTFGYEKPHLPKFFARLTSTRRNPARNGSDRKRSETLTEPYAKFSSL